MDMQSGSSLFRLLGDAARLRLLRVLVLAGHDSGLNVTELTGVLGIAQSGVSRHLRLLKDAGLVTEDRGGGFSYYRIAPAFRNGDADSLWPALQAQFAAEARTPVARADEARLLEILRLRKENFEVHGTARAQFVPGRSWAAWARAIGILLPPVVVADLACGEGYLTMEMARWARQVVAIDRSAAVLKRARTLAKRRGISNIVWKQGDIERVPLPAASVDIAVFSQALHHAVEPARALAEAARIVRPGGRILILDLRAHHQAWVRDRVGDRWLGFADKTLERLLRAQDLQDVTVRVGARLAGDPFTVLIASGVKPEAHHVSTKAAAG